MIELSTVKAISSNFIDNGDFESGNLSPWTTWASSVASVTTNSYYIHSGSYGCELEEYISGIYERSSIQQVVDYDYDELASNAITFWMKCDGGGVTLRVYYTDESTNYLDFLDSTETWIMKTFEKDDLLPGKDIAKIKLTSKYDGYQVAVDDININTADLQNPDFESGELAPWTTWSSASASVTSSEHYSGSYSCKLYEYIGGIYERSSIQQAIECPVNQLESVAISFYMKGNGGAVRVISQKRKYTWVSCNHFAFIYAGIYQETPVI